MADTTASSETTPFLQQATHFLQALLMWKEQLPVLAWSDLQTEARQGHGALFCVDMINGFCHEGALASPRVQSIIPAVVATFEGAYAAGIRYFILPQDCHTPDAAEFASFPPHCQRGSSEAATIPELQALPFADLYTVFPKNSISSFYETPLSTWLAAHPELTTIIVVGDCTDLCVHQLALPLKLQANALNRRLRVIVPENAVQTYDLPLEMAQAVGALPHNGDVMHLLFLYHMQLNGIEVVREITT
jgi:nicotinamidase-related amidase